MKRRNEGRRSRKQPARAAAPPPSPPAAMPAPRRRLFRVAALLLVPLLLLGLLEGILRLVYPGYPTRFFLPATRHGTNILVTNDRFGLRFFPPGLARSPTPFAFPARKSPGTFRIFLFGESAALGDPRPAFGVGRYLQALLSERYPASRFEVIPAAMTAINSHALRGIARECRAYEGDLWIVYMGNNEMAGPFGAVTVFGPKTPPLAAIRASLALKTTRLGQLLDGVTRRLQAGASAPARWEGLQMFLDQSVPPGDPRRKVVLDHLDRNLRDMIAAATSAGIPVVLSTVASNLRDWAPFASAHSTDFGGTASNRFVELKRRAETALAAGQIEPGRQALAEAAAFDPRFASLRFRLGRAALAATNLAEAADHFIAARDHDALPFRTDSGLNDLIRGTAKEFADRRVALVDAEKALAAGAPAGGPGRDLFLDHVHLTFDGNYQLARLFADRVVAALRLQEEASGPRDWAAQETVERRLGLTDWNRASVLESMLQRLADGPFTNRLYHTEHLVALATQLSLLRKNLHPRFYLDARDLYEEAIRHAPDDPRLHENYAEFLESSGSLEEALQQWTAVGELLPDHHLAPFHQGRLCSRLKRHEEARGHLNRALAIRPDLEEARLEIGQSWFREGQYNEALTTYTELRRRQPGDARVLFHLAEALAATGRRPEATEALREAVRIRPNYSEAHYYLGVEYAASDQIDAARAEFETVLRVRPDHLLARLNLGVALARSRRFDDARRQFEAVLQLDPENSRALQHLQSLDSLLQSAKPPPAPQPGPPPE